jgi:hypothetical protein
MQIDTDNNVFVEEEEIFGNNHLKAIDTSLPNSEYVKMCIKRAQKLFYQECGNNEAKK